jgi:urease accessory protein
MLAHWLNQELRYGAVRLEAAVMVRGYRAAVAGDLDGLNAWNRWLSAARETEELRSQSWQMGRSLLRLLKDLSPDTPETDYMRALRGEWNFAIAFAIAAAHWQIDLTAAVSGYLHSWAANLISAGIKLIPLGQTAGQQVLVSLYPTIQTTAEAVLTLPDADLSSCGWGLALASMAHETLYTRLFRS